VAWTWREPLAHPPCPRQCLPSIRFHSSLPSPSTRTPALHFTSPSGQPPHSSRPASCVTRSLRDCHARCSTCLPPRRLLAPTHQARALALLRKRRSAFITPHSPVRLASFPLTRLERDAFCLQPMAIVSSAPLPPAAPSSGELPPALAARQRTAPPAPARAVAAPASTPGAAKALPAKRASPLTKGAAAKKRDAEDNGDESDDNEEEEEESSSADSSDSSSSESESVGLYLKRSLHCFVAHRSDTPAKRRRRSPSSSSDSDEDSEAKMSNVRPSRARASRRTRAGPCSCATRTTRRANAESTTVRGMRKSQSKPTRAGGRGASKAGGHCGRRSC